MIPFSLAPRLTAALLATSLLTSAAGGPARAAAADPLPDLIAALKATSPAAGPDPQQVRAIDGMIGTWRVDYGDISKTGVTTHRTGQFIVSWVLDGRAVQDVWIVDPSGARKTREVYSDLRWFDPKTGTWPAVFVDPEHASTARFTSEPPAPDRIVLHSPDLGPGDSRWSFVATGPDSLSFRDEASDDGGKTWRVRSDDHLTRQAPGGR
ncbi:MAG: hypothetical protein JF588_07315 [Caulobacterales bacterium]|nr:hypothetical protein [Caulobacterales bacterium]